MGRQFEFQKLTKEGAGEGLLDIPHPAVLTHKTPRKLLENFKNSFGMYPEGVVLPTIATDGLLYPCGDIDLPLSKYRTVGHYRGFEETIAAFAECPEIKKIYLSVDPTLQFVRTDALHVIDIAGDGSQQVCIINPRTRQLLGAILGIGVDLTIETLNEAKSQANLAGAVIDVVDLWPQGAKQERLELTCFCESCLKLFEETETGLLDHFRTFPNPWNLVLKDNQTGIGYIDELPKNIRESQILGLSRQKGYIDIFKDTDETVLTQHATHLLRYMQIRHNSTVKALDDIFKEAFKRLDEKKLQRILLLEGVHYDWTSGLQLQRLDDPDPGVPNFDEVWFNSTSSDMVMHYTSFRSYMWRRSRYLIDAFFQAIATAADPRKRNTTGIARYSEKHIRDELFAKRLGSAVSTTDSNRTSLAALPPLKLEAKEGEKEPGQFEEEKKVEKIDNQQKVSQRVGFVGVAFFDEAEGQEFLKTVIIAPSAQEKKGGSDREEMLTEMLKRLGGKE